MYYTHKFSVCTCVKEEILDMTCKTNKVFTLVFDIIIFSYKCIYISKCKIKKNRGFLFYPYHKHVFIYLQQNVYTNMLTAN